MQSRLTMLMAAAAFLASPGWGATLAQQLGTQDFINGTIVGSATFIGIPDVAPFNTISGSDVAGPNFSVSWTFDGYGPVVGSVSSATLLIASWDFDTMDTTVSHVASFDLNGILLTGVLDTAFKANPNTASGQILWYTIALPSTTFAQLATGSETFDLSLQNGAGVLGATQFNGGGMDFSTLTVNTAAATPEPITAVIMIGGLAGLALLRRRRTAA